MARRPDTPCAVCGKLLYGGNGTLPPGKRTCRDCRREHNIGYGPRGGQPPAQTANPYGSLHQRRKRELLPLAYGRPCAICGKVMLPDQKLDLDHAVPLYVDPRPRPGDRIVHAHCNRGWTRRGPVGEYKAKGSSSERGYGAAHQRLRREWLPKVERGEVCCAKCGEWIAPGTPWHLGHDDQDRTQYLGPLHRRCNCDTGAFRQRIVQQGQQRAASRDW